MRGTGISETERFTIQPAVVEDDSRAVMRLVDEMEKQKPTNATATAAATTATATTSTPTTTAEPDTTEMSKTAISLDSSKDLARIFLECQQRMQQYFDSKMDKMFETFRSETDWILEKQQQQQEQWNTSYTNLVKDLKDLLRDTLREEAGKVLQGAARAHVDDNGERLEVLQAWLARHQAKVEKSWQEVLEVLDKRLAAAQPGNAAPIESSSSSHSEPSFESRVLQYLKDILAESKETNDRVISERQAREIVESGLRDARTSLEAIKEQLLKASSSSKAGNFCRKRHLDEERDQAEEEQDQVEMEKNGAMGDRGSKSSKARDTIGRDLMAGHGGANVKSSEDQRDGDLNLERKHHMDQEATPTLSIPSSRHQTSRVCPSMLPNALLSVNAIGKSRKTSMYFFCVVNFFGSLTQHMSCFGHPGILV